MSGLLAGTERRGTLALRGIILTAAPVTLANLWRSGTRLMVLAAFRDARFNPLYPLKDEQAE
ncbi:MULTISPECIES: hypothetical protein, partial [unclassified Microbispora]|uniref:hypothetical protein n=1 Tax=unclassified Microbispora TaxID=2614687 RepID=UPI00197B9305